MHGLYYLFLHFWIQLFGSGEAVVRLPSAIAVAAAVAGVVVLAARLYDPFTAATAGAIAAVIPQLTRMAVEARSYAFAMAVAVWLTVLFVELLGRTTPSRRLWVAYAVGLAASVYLFLYLGLLLLVHAVVLLAKRPGRRGHAQVGRRGDRGGRAGGADGHHRLRGARPDRLPRAARLCDGDLGVRAPVVLLLAVRDRGVDAHRGRRSSARSSRSVARARSTWGWCSP